MWRSRRPKLFSACALDPPCSGWKSHGSHPSSLHVHDPLQESITRDAGAHGGGLGMTPPEASGLT